MKRLFYQTLFGLATLGFPAVGTGQDFEEPEAEVEDVIRSEPIDAGYVILDGVYVEPPYVLERRSDDLWINDQLAISGWFARFRGPRGMGKRGGFWGRRWNDGPNFGGPRGEGPPAFGARGRHAAQPQQNDGLPNFEVFLEEEGMIIAGEGLRGCLLGKTQAAGVVGILQSGRSHEEKLAGLIEDVPGQMDSGSWQRLIETFQPSVALMTRIGPEIERVQKIVAENQAAHVASLASVYWNSRPVKYVITLMAMGLVVAACGTLLNYRPTGRGAWSEVDTAGEGIPIVVRSVILLILLGIFDLGCTLVAQQAGGFTEMNPLGSRVVENPLLLTTFKLTTLLLACAILYALRRYRGAQVAAWWMCLLCTVLTFRWLTYNSMFMS